MTAAFLQSELGNLISDAKRKHTDIRSAAEKSLSDLKTISITSETQLAGDLLRKTQFIDPLVLACKSQNAKFASTGTACLQRLIASKAIPRSRISDVLSAFQDAVTLALEVQLKILQTLPSLLQLYASDLHGESLAITLGISAELSANKLAVVSNTAAATFQQLVTSVFERSSREHIQEPDSDAGSQEATADDVQDAALVFSDICALLTGDSPKFVRLSGLAPALILETIENLLSTHGVNILANKSSIDPCQKYLIQGVTRLIEGSTNFGVVARSFRITFILATEHFEALKSTLESTFLTILAALDRSSGSRWKRALCLEFFRGICADFETLRGLFSNYDQSQDSKRIVFELMATLVRIASEDPSLIGLGRQSTIPTNQGSDDTGDAPSTVDVTNASSALGNVAQASSNSAGISTEWSTTTTSCMDQVDRTNAPDLPETYLYTLALGCVAALSDGLSKYVMPLSMPAKKQTKVEDMDETNENVRVERSRSSSQRASTSHKHQQLVNPLTKPDTGKLEEVRACAKMIEDCWPAVLAICSTFLNAALDSYFYHVLVRTVQKLAQVSGVLELNTPRDALLTTLAKVSVPINISRLMNYHYGGRSASLHDGEPQNDTQIASPATPVSVTQSGTLDMSRQILNLRNLLCLRALLNLGIALGPTLSDSAWTIILQSLQQVEALMSIGPTPNASASQSNRNDGQTIPNLGSEIAAVDTATKRLVESTKTYSDLAFTTLLQALFSMADELFPQTDKKSSALLSPVDQNNTSPLVPRHKSSRSVSGSWTKATISEIEVQFILRFLSKLAIINIRRFSSPDSAAITWDIIGMKLLVLHGNEDIKLNLRLKAADVVNLVIIECGKTPEVDDDSVSVVRKYALPCLQRELNTLPKHVKDVEAEGIRVDMHQNLLRTLETLIGECGESLQAGWTVVLEILQATVDEEFAFTSEENYNQDTEAATVLHQKPTAAAFRCVQLIVSDFLAALENSSLARLSKLLVSFGTQSSDLNMSLTAIALYWNITTLLLEHVTPNSGRDLDFTAVCLSVEGSQIQTSFLWYVTLECITRICDDRRSNVRIAAIRMLLKTLEASSQQLNPESLNLCTRDILLPLIDTWTRNNIEDIEDSTDTILQLIQGTTSWVQGSVSAVVLSSSFVQTWSRLCQSFGKVLVLSRLPTTAAVYSALTSVISTLASLEEVEPTFSEEQVVESTWMLWLNHHPSFIQSQEESNEPALTAHGLLFDSLWKFSPSAIDTKCGIELNDPVFTSVHRTAFSARHTRYSNDTNKLSPEQDAVLQSQHILRQIFVQHQKQRLFNDGLLNFIIECCNRAEYSAETSQTSGQKNGLQLPTFVSLLSKCLEILKDLIMDTGKSQTFVEDLSIDKTLRLLADLVSRSQMKSKIRDSTVNPVRRRASIAAVELVIAIEKHLNTVSDHDVENIAGPLNEITGSLITADNLDVFTTRPTPETLLAYEAEDIELFQRTHRAAQTILERTTFPELSRKQYVLTLFNESLVAKPWFGDFPKDMMNTPLQDFQKIRLGSLRAPDLPSRRTIYTEAFDALLGLVATHKGDVEGTRTSNVTSLAIAAAPYVILRIAHPLKVFLADQRLRYLTPPHPALQAELEHVLTKALDLRTKASVFENIIGVEKAAVADDGKTHLRLLYPHFARFKKMWIDLPRLDFCAWQDDREGRAIENALDRWSESLSEGWGMM